MGTLSDCISCVVEETLNGAFELEMEYRLNGIHYEDIQSRSIILTRPNPFAQPQPFRVYRITRPLNGVVTVYAQHISYDLSGIIVEPFQASSLATALEGIVSNSVNTNPFHFETNKTILSDFKVSYPSSARSLVAGQRGSLLDTYGGELEFDRFTAKLLTHRGEDRGVTLRFGKNLTDLEQDQDASGMYTGIYPYWYSEEEGYVDLNGGYLPVEGTFSFSRLLPLDLSADFQSMPTMEQLTEAAQKYLSSHDLGMPTISTTISWYQSPSFVEKVSLGDVVRAFYSRLGVTVKAKVVKTRYNVLQNRYESVEVGSVRSSIAGTIVTSNQSLSSVTQYTVTETRRISKELESTAEALRSAIRDSAGNASQILQQAESIVAKTLEEYATTQDMNTLRTSLESQLSILAGQVEVNFSSSTDEITELNGNTSRQFEEIRSFIRLLAQTDTVNGGSGTVNSGSSTERRRQDTFV